VLLPAPFSLAHAMRRFTGHPSTRIARHWKVLRPYGSRPPDGPRALNKFRDSFNEMSRNASLLINCWPDCWGQGRELGGFFGHLLRRSS
jgi:hypothetical protein